MNKFDFSKEETLAKNSTIISKLKKSLEEIQSLQNEFAVENKLLSDLKKVLNKMEEGMLLEIESREEFARIINKLAIKKDTQATIGE